MRVSRRIALCFLSLTAGFAPPLFAQSDDVAYVVTYIEVVPTATQQAIGLLKMHSEMSRGESGNSQFQVLQRIGRPNHFALLETWSNVDTQAEHAAADHTKNFRANLEPILYSPYDERRHTNLDVAPGSTAEGAVYGLTHVDVIPTQLEAGVGYVRELVASSRHDAGNLRFDVMSQDSRVNHMTLVESWGSAATQAAHSATDHARTFRASMLPLSGSLYDERLYRAL